MSQLNQPNIKPSPTKRRAMVQEEAPMARMTPISRRRSRTLKESTPLSAMPPTYPMTMDMVTRRVIMTPKLFRICSVIPLAVSRPKGLWGLTSS